MSAVLVVNAMGQPTRGHGAERLALPWLSDPLERAAHLDRVHALLIQGPAGAGHLELALLLARRWLCEGPGAPPCGQCASCRQAAARTHPDLLVVVPDALRDRLGWSEGDEGTPAKAEAKPSREIRIQQVRQAIGWSQTSTGRGRGKVLVLHPGDALNATAANALLKTLEEPPGRLRILLTAVDADRLLATVRSRCQRLPLALPPAELAAAWLAGQGVQDPQALLALAGGSPVDALELAGEGIDAPWRSELPRRVAAGDARQLLGRPIPLVIDLLAKLAHDAAAVAAGAAPRYYPAESLTGVRSMTGWTVWRERLLEVSRHEGHAWNAALLIEALVTQASLAWREEPFAGVPTGTRSLHSPR